MMLQKIAKFHHSYTWQKLLVLCVAALVLRAGTFYFYVQHNERYHQADSNDYHSCALGIALDRGMCRVDNNHPIFWRTPAYPWYLSKFYKWYGITSPVFEHNSAPQKTAVWVQLIVCSILPLLVFFLALALTGVVAIAWIAAWISVFHLGFVLASTFLLTDAFGLLFFVVFLTLFYKSFSLWKEPHKKPLDLRYLLAAAVLLGLYTWIRPVGQFVAVLSAILLLCAQYPFKEKLIKGALFLAVFFLVISPWYMRNYQITGEWFYCPMFGSNLQAFCVPKIMRTVTGQPLLTCFNYAMGYAQQQITAERERAQIEAPGFFVPQELVCFKIALPIVLEHPFYFISDWMREVGKATFDLYASQLVAFAGNCYKYDPLEEFLPEKVQQCLYKQQMPFAMRILAWLEFLFSLALWGGIFAGIWFFIFQPLYAGHRSPYVREMFFLWLKTGLFIAGVLVMTGSFGYARLRMPVDPLLIILSLSFWYWWWQHFYKTRRK